MFRSPLVLIYLAAETCAGVLKANWKLFPGTTPHSMPFDSWIIFLEFWRNLLFSPLLCIFGAELFPVFPHSCLSERRNHKNAAKQSLSIELQFHLWRLESSPASSGFRAVSGAFRWPARCLLPKPTSPPADQLATWAIRPSQDTGNHQRIHRQKACRQMQHSFATHSFSCLTVGFSNLCKRVWFRKLVPGPCTLQVLTLLIFINWSRYFFFTPTSQMRKLRPEIK